jgi:hypothetical protein
MVGITDELDMIRFQSGNGSADAAATGIWETIVRRNFHSLEAFQLLSKYPGRAFE